MATVKSTPKYDNWSSKYAERSSATVRFMDSFNPNGAIGVTNFFLTVEHYAKQKISFPCDWFNLPNSQRPFSDKRFLFNTVQDRIDFTKVLERLSFESLKIISVIYTDVESSRQRLDNDSVRILIGEEGGQKTSKIISRADGSVILPQNDPYRVVLGRLADSSATPLSSPATTPTPSPDHLSMNDEINSERTDANEKNENKIPESSYVPSTHASAKERVLLLKSEMKQKMKTENPMHERLLSIKEITEEIEFLCYMLKQYEECVECGTGWTWKQACEIFN